MLQEEQEGLLREAELEVERQAALRANDWLFGLFFMALIVSTMANQIHLGYINQRVTELERQVQLLAKDSER